MVIMASWRGVYGLAISTAKGGEGGEFCTGKQVYGWVNLLSVLDVRDTYALGVPIV